MSELKPSILDDARRAKVDAALAALVDSGDLDRLVQLAVFFGGAQVAMTDDMIVRLAGIASHGMSLVERTTRTGLADQLLALAGDFERSGLAPDLLNAIDVAAKETAAAPRPKGGMRGLMGLYALMKDPETQRAMHFAIAMICCLCKARVSPHIKSA
jgi:uncharacterized protein YjgD (DUF1641 family)